MLTGIFPAYVDRFACDWHRLATTDPILPTAVIIDSFFVSRKHLCMVFFAFSGAKLKNFTVYTLPKKTAAKYAAHFRSGSGAGPRRAEKGAG